MSSKLRQNLINELSELSISLSDTLELVGETDLESNEMAIEDSTASSPSNSSTENATQKTKTADKLIPDTDKA